MYYENPDGVSLHDGFPNPATDTSLQILDLNQLLVWHSASTFMMRVSGSEWEAAGIFDGDIALIDRALKPRPIDLVAWISGAEFVICRFTSLKERGEMWGVVTSVVHQYRRKS